MICQKVSHFYTLSYKSMSVYKITLLCFLKKQKTTAEDFAQQLFCFNSLTYDRSKMFLLADTAEEHACYQGNYGSYAEHILSEEDEYLPSRL